MFGEEYRTVLHKAAGKDGNWGLAFALASRTPEDCVNYLEDAFAGTAAAKNDGGAAECFGFLMHAVADTINIPVLVQKDYQGKTIQVLPGDNARSTRVQVAKGAKAMALYPTLPNEEVCGRGEGRQRYPVLLKTREAMLREIALAWAVAAEEEWRLFFESLVNTPLNFEEEGKILCEVARAVTDKRFPRERLFASLAHLAEHETELRKRADQGSSVCDNELACIIAIAAVRTQNAMALAREASVLAPLIKTARPWQEYGISPLLLYMARVAKEAAELDLAAQELYREFDSNPIVLRYPRADCVEIASHFMPRCTPDQREINGYHHLFEELAAKVRVWRERHPHYSAKFTFTVQPIHDKEPVLTRTEG